MLRQIITLAALLAAAILLIWGLTQTQPDRYAIFLGYVEGETLFIGPTEGERLVQLDVAIGDVVVVGAPLFRMSTELLERQHAEAVARIHQFEAQGQNLRAAMNRPQQIAVLQAGLERAQASLTLSKADYERQQILFSENHIARAALDRAAMALARDEAGVKEARRQVESAEMASRSQEINAAEAATAQARAALEALDIRFARQTVKAPAAGVVQDVFFRVGEVVAAGQPVVALLPPENRKLRFYVPETELATLHVGDKLTVLCDGCSGNLYARISYIAARQEYTPPVIYSDEERAKLVFKVEARLEDMARNLPLGLPVRVRIATDSVRAAR